MRYLKRTEEISRYLCKIIRHHWGYFCRFNKSDCSDSWYLNINLGTKENPNAIHVRIANHTALRETAQFHYDICTSKNRNGAMNYIKFLFAFAKQQGKLLPQELKRLQPGTPCYKNYVIGLQT